MKHFAPVIAILGGVLMLFSLAMLVPLGFAWVGNDAALWAYDGAIAITFFCGALLFFGLRNRVHRELQPRE
jgi:trk system potassium uptake protein TrkH